jgi:putative transposase
MPAHPLNQPLYPDTFYHVYNRGNNHENLFYNAGNYQYFLKKYHDYISAYADTYAYCLLPNHFHFLIRVKSLGDISNKEMPNLKDLAFLKTEDLSVDKIISNLFRLLFLGYAKAINKQEDRRGSLFQKPFRRKPVMSDRYLASLIYYIHNNPVHHGFCKKLTEYPWSSFETLCEENETWLKRSEVLDFFGGRKLLQDYHDRSQSDDQIKDLLIEE